MNPKDLTARITIEQPVDAKDSIGQMLPGWSTLVSVWADVRHQSGLESIKADASVSTVKASIRIRFRTDVDAGMRVQHGAAVYNIKAVLPDAGRKFVDLVCERAQ